MTKLLITLTAVCSMVACKSPPAMSGPAAQDATVMPAGPDSTDVVDTSAFIDASQDATVSQGDVPSAASDEQESDVSTLDVEDSIDTSKDIDDADSIDAPVACSGTVSLPSPGVPCTTEGATRCTNVGESEKLGTTGKFCVRPNRVVCQKSAGSGLVWQLDACPIADNACTLGDPNSCQENSRGAHCCPLSIQFQPSPELSIYGQCDPALENATSCLPPNAGAGPGGQVWRCTFSDTPAMDSQAQKLKTPFPKCAFYCEDCLFWMADKVCPPLLASTCASEAGIDPESVKYQTIVECITSIPGNSTTTCVSNCSDWKYAPDYPK